MKDNGFAITARGLAKRFGDFTAVAGIDFQVRRGEIFGFLGPNGSGKTTTIRMMLGLLKPSAGSVEVLGIPVSERAKEIRPRVGYMSQRFSLYNDLSVLQNLRFYGRAYGLGNALLRERIQNALHMAGLEGRERTATKASPAAGASDWPSARPSCTDRRSSFSTSLPPVWTHSRAVPSGTCSTG